jgi:protein TonB
MSAVTEPNRAFKYAVLASIVLHAAALLGLSQRDRPRLAATDFPPLLARLTEAPAPAPVAAAAPRPQSEPVKQKVQPKPAAPKRIAKPAPSPIPTPQPAAEPAVQEAPVAQAPTETTSPERPAPREIAGVEEAKGTTDAVLAAAPPAGAPVDDPGSLEKYRLQLKLVAARYKRYPRMANDNDWKGLVALRMVVAPSGHVASLTVTKTSGYDVLDRQAQEMFRKAAADVPVPPVLRGKQFSLDVAVDYYLTD